MSKQEHLQPQKRSSYDDLDDLYSDKQYVLEAVQQDGLVLKHATEELRGDRQIVMAAVQQNGRALRFASTSLRRDKSVVLAALTSYPEALRYAHEDAKQNSELLVAAGMLDENRRDAAVASNESKKIRKPKGKFTLFSWFHRPKTTKPKKRIALSTRYSLDRSSFSDATNFTKLLKEHEYIQTGGFQVYAPNAFDKKTCDPDWTNFDHPCRGTKETCQFHNKLKTGHPTNDSCWRYSFRYQLELAKETEGFLLQLVEREEWWIASTQALGKGQTIEQDMAQQLQVKIFRVYRPEMGKLEAKFQMRHIDEVVLAIQQWYEEGCRDMSECVVRPAFER